MRVGTVAELALVAEAEMAMAVAVAEMDLRVTAVVEMALVA